jgi:glucose/arabinose dehydrogenase
MRRILLVLALLIMVERPELAASAERHLDRIKLPPGFQISLLSADVPSARAMVFSPGGTLFVGSMKGNVYAIPNSDKDYRKVKVINIARGLDKPAGVDFRDGSLYVSAVNRILRYDNIESRLDNPPEPVVVSEAFPNQDDHEWKFIRFGPDGLLYVPVGAPCNICKSKDERFASIMRMKPDGTDLEIFARGIRNTVGFDWHPETKDLWFTDNGRDWMGDNLPPDELNYAPTKGLNFGYPYCHGGDIPDPEFGKERPCGDFTPPAMKLGPHVASLGMRFYTGKMFPREYRDQIFIAEHGSWNRSRKIGYRITLVRLDGNKAISYDVFADGWEKNEHTWGRPADVQVAPDGSLLVSDDYAGSIYRITYSAK